MYFYLRVSIRSYGWLRYRMGKICKGHLRAVCWSVFVCAPLRHKQKMVFSQRTLRLCGELLQTVSTSLLNRQTWLCLLQLSEERRSFWMGFPEQLLIWTSWFWVNPEPLNHWTRKRLWWDIGWYQEGWHKRCEKSIWLYPLLGCGVGRHRTACWLCNCQGSGFWGWEGFEDT